MTENCQRAGQAPLFPLRPLPHIQHHSAVTWLPHPGEHLRLRPLLQNRHAETSPPNTAQMKEQIKAPEKIKLSDEEIANLSDACFKTLVIRMLTEMVEYGCKMEEKVKAMKSEVYAK